MPHKVPVMAKSAYKIPNFVSIHQRGVSCSLSSLFSTSLVQLPISGPSRPSASTHHARVPHPYSSSLSIDHKADFVARREANRS